MFDIGTGELALIAVVALLVLGPERLPKAARTAGALARRARASWQNVRAEIERELAAEELKQSIKRGLDEANPSADISAALRDAVHGPAKPPEPPATTDGQH
ncbi:MAG: twin-arginine translocase subunit TatB [Proteobacteria bacterium]|jgi:sec-independent protein translocase protein TatB|nr:twin-arginine translocase subunit TatB [Pseudomonadota bacterium]MCE7950172.1 twin-arginine translocase subunit TatB [Xanthomonadales bacterium PRO7]